MLGSKLLELKGLQNKCRLDVVVLSETKLHGFYKQEIVYMEGYSCVRQDKRSDSLRVYTSKDIPYTISNISVCVCV